MRTLMYIVVGFALLGAVAAPMASAQDPDPRPLDCELRWEPVLSFYPDGPTIYRPYYKCYT